MSEEKKKPLLFKLGKEVTNHVRIFLKSRGWEEVQSEDGEGSNVHFLIFCFKLNHKPHKQPVQFIAYIFNLEWCPLAFYDILWHLDKEGENGSWNLFWQVSFQFLK